MNHIHPTDHSIRRRNRFAIVIQWQNPELVAQFLTLVAPLHLVKALASIAHGANSAQSNQIPPAILALQWLVSLRAPVIVKSSAQTAYVWRYDNNPENQRHIRNLATLARRLMWLVHPNNACTCYLTHRPPAIMRAETEIWQPCPRTLDTQASSAPKTVRLALAKTETLEALLGEWKGGKPLPQRTVTYCRRASAVHRALRANRSRHSPFFTKQSSISSENASSWEWSLTLFDLRATDGGQAPAIDSAMWSSHAERWREWLYVRAQTARLPEAWTAALRNPYQSGPHHRSPYPPSKSCLSLCLS